MQQCKLADIYRFLRLKGDCDELPVERIKTVIKLLPGVEKHVDAENSTLLHLLMMVIGRNRYLADVPREHNYQKGLLDCVKLVLQLGADPNAKNSRGYTPITCLLAWRGMCHVYSSCLTVIVPALELLLQHGANPEGDSKCPPLVLVARYWKYIFGSNLMIYGESLAQLFRLLLMYGANPNATDGDGYPPLLHIIHRCLTNFTAAKDSFCSKSVFQSFLINYLNDLFVEFLKHGLDPNSTLQYRVAPIEHFFKTSYIAELIFILCDESVHWEVIVFRHGLCQLLRTLISYGANLGNTNLNSMSVHPLANIKHVRCTLTELLAFRMVDTVHDSDEGLAVWRFTEMMIRGMPHCKQQEFIGVLLRNLRQEQLNVGYGLFRLLLQRRLERPYTLQELSRVAVSHSLRWRLAQYSHKLGLPSPLVLCLATVGDTVVKPDISITPYSHIRIKDTHS